MSPSLHYSTDLLSGLLLLQPTGESDLALTRHSLERNNQFGITMDNDIWIVGDNDDLPRLFGVS